MSTEHWLPVPGFEGIYEVSDMGSVRSLPRIDASGHRRSGRLLRPGFVPDGYPTYVLCKPGIPKRCYSAHRLVALAFLENPEGKPHVNHKDGNKKNPALTNLEWATVRENVLHAIDTGLRPLGERHWKCVVPDSRVKDIRELKSLGYKPTAIARALELPQSAVNHIYYGASRVKTALRPINGGK